MEWSEKLNCFWSGMMNNEYIAWKGSHQIFVYPCDEYPKPPSGIIDWDKRIETVEEFEKAMLNGVYKKATYEEGE